ncbi:MAG TPA: hypothetical protein EYP56_22695 [Planctomycetaceae bacterium]|nr:hypothetical protein [Planctomycetaceae bacterium]
MRAYGPLVRRIRQIEGQLRDVPDRGLADRAGRLRVGLAARPSDAEYQSEAFALACEAIRRVVGLEPYGVQVLAGLVIAEGHIAEMHTGEGKTLAAVPPAVFRVLCGQKVHVATANQYLADRDFELLEPVYRLLGIRCGALHADAQPAQKRAAYRSEVTYGPGYEFGFDYLRDQLALLENPPQRLGQRFRRHLRGRPEVAVPILQPEREFAILDEVDSVLVDDARTPLILCGARDQQMPPEEAAAFLKADQLAVQLTPGRHFGMDRKKRHIWLTQSGLAKAQTARNFMPALRLHRPWQVYLENALFARYFLRRDVHYVVDGEAIQLVEETTGRIFADRSWRGGLHQAVQAKERLPITYENQSLARISRQRFYQLYQTLSGMTGTALEAAGEFWQLYRLRVLPIPLNRPSRRRELPAECFAEQGAKWQAVVEEIRRVHATGQPILVGTRSIRNSELLSELLKQAGVPHEVLNGKQDAEEAELVARAGQLGAVTVATDMAGRGTDIKVHPDALALGGLYVIATERHESRRVDRQLIGRCARQGEPGMYRFFLAADDDLIQTYAPQIVPKLQRVAAAGPSAATSFQDAVDRVQRRAEKLARAQRLRLYQFDRWLEGATETLTRPTPLKDNPVPF